MEEQTSHYVQLEDGTYAEMVEGHEIVKPGQQMLVNSGVMQPVVTRSSDLHRGAPLLIFYCLHSDQFPVGP